MPLNLTRNARDLRRHSTDAERLLWRHLRDGQLDGCKFRRQEQIGHFIVDFVCYEKALVVEADGGQHALEEEKDAQRTAWLNSQGFQVLRFWNNEILTNIDGVMERLREELSSEPPSPRPLRLRSGRTSPTEGRGSVFMSWIGWERGKSSLSLQRKCCNFSTTIAINVPSPLVGEGQGENTI